MSRKRGRTAAAPAPHRSPPDVDLILERSRNQTRALTRPNPRLASKVRDELIKAVAPITEHGFYDPDAFALVEEFEAALRHAWERIEQAEARARAEAAIADALNMPRQWRLM